MQEGRDIEGRAQRRSQRIPGPLRSGVRSGSRPDFRWWWWEAWAPWVGRLKSPVRHGGVVRGPIGAATSVAGAGGMWESKAELRQSSFRSPRKASRMVGGGAPVFGVFFWSAATWRRFGWPRDQRNGSRVGAVGWATEVARPAWGCGERRVSLRAVGFCVLGRAPSVGAAVCNRRLRACGVWRSKAELRRRLTPQSKERGRVGWRERIVAGSVVVERGDLAPLWMAEGSTEWEPRGRRGLGD